MRLSNPARGEAARLNAAGELLNTVVVLMTGLVLDVSISAIRPVLVAVVLRRTDRELHMVFLGESNQSATHHTFVIGREVTR